MKNNFTINNEKYSNVSIMSRLEIELVEKKKFSMKIEIYSISCSAKLRSKIEFQLVLFL